MIYTPVPVFPEEGAEAVEEGKDRGRQRPTRVYARARARAHDKICDGRNFPGEKIKVLASTPPYL